MATASPAKCLQDEATCSICLDYFQDPVMISNCGHNFCRTCIIEYKKSDINICCPECRRSFSREHLKPNRPLGRMAEAAKQLSLQINSPAKKRMCLKHKQPLIRFCKEDETLLCCLCEESKAHRNHTVVYAEAAAADYKMKLQKRLENLKKEKNKILSVKSNGEKPSQELLKEMDDKKSSMVSEFQQIVQFLKEKEQFQLSRLGELEAETERTRKDYGNKFDDEISYITNLIGEIEKKNGQPPSEFLEDIGSILDRCEKEKFKFPPPPDTSDIKKRLEQFSQQSTGEQSTLRKFRALQQQLQEEERRQQMGRNVAASAGARRGRNPAQEMQEELQQVVISRLRDNMLRPRWIKENVYLDPETAHPRYIVSQDGKSVEWGEIRQDFPYNPKRFQYARCVLGCEGFTSGKHYWTVSVGDGDYWAVGVARESVERGEEIDFDPDEGIWALGRYDDQYKALTSPPTLLELDYEPTEIQVSLNYEAGKVHFYDGEDKTRIYTFDADFEGEAIFPFFRIVDSSTCLQLCS
ncbi:zinc finger protein RFP-like isoform X2 [Hemicordylus capensis]|uniref:zinc finger protein RFP-like isoform X2 n=1 Tax=Hemicordylus capensis TaxID=884348 RepID=UPI002302995F|nr:zinc finger protein RFP-like isoform X2 [Hemicordylus capensis]